jgi:hypothetical protein
MDAPCQPLLHLIYCCRLMWCSTVKIDKSMGRPDCSNVPLTAAILGSGYACSAHLLGSQYVVNRDVQGSATVTQWQLQCPVCNTALLHLAISYLAATQLAIT